MESSAFWHLSFHGFFFFSTISLIFGRKIPLFSFLRNAFLLSYFLVGFSFKFLDLFMLKPVVFVDVPPDRIQHKFFIYFFRSPVVKPSEIFIFLDVPKMSLGLD